jgi:SAM-dependent methyltransferase
VVCGATGVSHKFTSKGNPVWECSRCHLVFLHPQPSDEVLAGIYSEGYFMEGDNEQDRAITSAMKAETARLYVDRLVAYMGPQRGRLLEIGCGNGHFLRAARDAGFQVQGMDVSAHSCKVANQRLGGEFVFCGNAENLEPPAEPYDVCALFDVIEHVRNPVKLLQRVRAFLKPEGVLFLCTPNLHSWSARVMRKRWSEFKTEHLTYFGVETIRNLLAKTGYTRVEISPNHKALTLDYIHRHFQRFPVAGLSSVLAAVRRLIPEPIRHRPFHIVVSGMNVLSRVSEKRERPLLSLIVPVYNEKKTFALMMERVLGKTVPGIDREIVLIESNSTDGSREEVEKFRDIPSVRILYEDRPRGKGHAVRAGLAQARGDFVLIQDADLEYDVNDYDALLEPLRNYSRAFVLGSRHISSWKIRQFSTQPLLSMVMNLAHWGFTALINLTCASRMRDPFTMYKVFRRDCLHGLALTANRFDFDWELVIKLLRKGYVPLEIAVNYQSRSFGDGKKVAFFRDPITWVWALLRYRIEPLRKCGNGVR